MTTPAAMTDLINPTPADENGVDCYSLYIPVGREASVWGISVVDLGYAFIPPHIPYPTGEHPETHSLNLEKGRILDDSQIIYITRGSGRFWSEASGDKPIVAGSVITLFPGVRHHYRPDPEVGWDEIWSGFTGPLAHRLISQYSSPESPIMNSGIRVELNNLFRSICDYAKLGGFGFRPIIASQVMEIIAHLHALSHRQRNAHPQLEGTVQRTCLLLHEKLPKSFDFKLHARENGLSYSSFRRLFKAHTGLAPNRYLIDVKIRKACQLLTNTLLPIGEIADASGFESNYYFSRIFKQRMGVPPIEYRNRRAM